MRLFFRNVGIFILCLLAASIAIIATPIPKQYRYSVGDVTCGDGHKGQWIYHRMFIDTNDIDLAFFGTSLTMCAIDDALISKNTKYNSVNLGYCWGGRSVEYFLFKDLLINHSPKAIFLEVPTIERRFTHRFSAYFGSTLDILFPVLFFNQRYFDDLTKLMKLKLKYIKKRISNQIEIPVSANKKLHNHRKVFKTVELEKIVQAKERRKDLDHNPTSKMGRVSHDISSSLSKKYLQKIAALAQTSSTDLYFIYMPVYGVEAKPVDLDFYKSMGTVLFIPPTILENPKNWCDTDHLNNKGASLTSLYLAEEIAKN